MLSSASVFAKLLSRFPGLRDPGVSILEVSTSPASLESLAGRPVTHAIVPTGDAAGRDALTADALAAVLPSSTFDVVVAHGVAERLAPRELGTALAHLRAMATQRLLVSCACGPAAQAADAAIRAALQGAGRSTPALPGLGTLPSVRDLYRALERTGARVEFAVNETVLQHQASVLLEALVPAASQFAADATAKSPASPPVAGSPWDRPYSFVFDATPAGTEPAPAPVSPEDTRPREGGVRMYSVFHRYDATAALGRVTPIFVGAAADEAPPGALTDIPSEGPRLDNSRWCEVTAALKIWRDGPVSEAVGLCHYRRFLDFSGLPRETREVVVPRRELPSIRPHLVPPDEVLDAGQKDWIVTAHPLPLKTSPWELYAAAHRADDYCRVLNIVARRHRHLAPFVSEQFGTDRMFVTNMFVLPWHLFGELCALWFDVLGEFEADTAAEDATPYQRRAPGFLSERLFDLWLRWKRRTGARVITRPVFLVEG